MSTIISPHCPRMCSRHRSEATHTVTKTQVDLWVACRFFKLLFHFMPFVDAQRHSI